MPEFPEVATVIRYLRNNIINRKISSISLKYSPVVKNYDYEKFIVDLKNQKFLNIEQKGKYLIFNLTNNKTLIIHLRMEGKLFVQDKNSLPNFKQLICEFNLDNDKVLRFYDTRKFGTFDLINTSDLNQFWDNKKIAMDVIDTSFNSEYLYNISRKSTQAIKTFLLDQSNVAGLGNIYVNEVLFESNVIPTRPTKLITKEECDLIVEHSKRIINHSISLNGTTIHTYKFSEYDSGGYQDFLKVHSRKGMNCFKCNNSIQFMKVNGRGTYYCKNCQR